jgi:hypothetical protein
MQSLSSYSQEVNDLYAFIDSTYKYGYIEECKHDNGELYVYDEYENGISIGEWAEFDRGGALVSKGRMLTEDEKGVFSTKLIEITEAERIDVSISYEGYSENEKYNLITIISDDSIKPHEIDDFVKENFGEMKIKEEHFVDLMVIRKFNDFEHILSFEPNEFE